MEYKPDKDAPCPSGTFVQFSIIIQLTSSTAERFISLENSFFFALCVIFILGSVLFIFDTELNKSSNDSRALEWLLFHEYVVYSEVN